MAIETKTIRADEETYARFREIASAEFANQGLCLRALVDNYELAQQRNQLPNRAVEIDTFQMHALELVKMYTQALQIYQEADALARSAVERDMVSKDKHIADLQDRLQAATEVKKQLQSEMDAALKSETAWREEAQGLEQDLRQKQKEFSELLRTKEQLLAERQDKIKSLTDTIAKLESERIEQKQALAEFESLDQKHKALEQELAELQKTCERERYQAELAYEKQLLAKDRELQAAVQAAREEAYQQQQQQSARIDSLRDEVDALRRQLAAATKQETPVK